MSQYRKLAESYCKLLNSIDWTDELVVKGLKEGLNKFLSNAFASQSHFQSMHKHHKTHLISSAALQQLKAKKYPGLRYEHLVPKQKYIQGPCEERAKKGELTVDFVEDLLNKHWEIATITKEEDELLHRTKMPVDWDGVNRRARYENAGIELQKNPFYRNHDESVPKIVEIIEQIGGK